jgi:hypothetical protein
MQYLAVKLAPQVELMALPIADPGTLVFPVLAFVGVPRLGTVGESVGAPPAVLYKSFGDRAINRQICALGRLDPDLIVGIGCRPCADVLPIEIVAHSLSWLLGVEKVDVVLIGTVAPT